MKKYRLNSVALLVAGVGSTTCVPTFQDDTSSINEVRVLAVRAEPAEPAPGQETQLFALVATPQDNQASSELRWSLCHQRRAPTEVGPVAQVCVTEFGSASDYLTPLGQGDEVQLAVPTDACRIFGPLPPPIATGESVAGRAAAPDQSGGFYQPVMVGLGDAASAPALSGVRLLCGGAGLAQADLVTFNRGYRPNQNPVLDELSVMLEGEKLDLEGTPRILAGATLQLKVAWAACPETSACGDGLCTAGENATECAEDCRSEPVGCTGAEHYLFADPQSKEVVEKIEGLEVSWFANAGTFKEAITDDSDTVNESVNEWTAPEGPGVVGLWIVVRDSRRGTTWKTLSFDVTQ